MILEGTQTTSNADVFMTWKKNKSITDVYWHSGVDGATSEWKLVFGNGASPKSFDGNTVLTATGSSGNLTISGDAYADNFILNSDIRLKTDIKDVDYNDHIKADWKTFKMKDKDTGIRYGVIAQELEAHHPEFVEENTKGYKSVKYIDLLIAKIAELEARLEQLEK